MTPDQILREFVAADRHAHTPSVWQEIREEFGSMKRALFGWGVVMALLFFGTVWAFWFVGGVSASTSAGHYAVHGPASWYADPKARQGSFYAAVPGYRGHPYFATVWHGSRHVRVLVQDWCGCPGGRVIDLSWHAFVSLGVPLSRGLTGVVVTDERPS